jgi:MFS family permease
MNDRLDVAKVVYGAFLVPWINRRSFARALAVPVGILVTLALSSYYLGDHVPQAFHWLLYVAYWIVFTLFAVTCHRLVLLDSATIGAEWLPHWPRRQTRFLLWFIAVWLIFGLVIWPLWTVLGNVLHRIPGPWQDLSVKEQWDWAFRVSVVPAFYIFGRLCVIFPATALDGVVNLRWAWQLTRKNGLRLLLVAGALPWVMSQLVDLVYRDDATIVEAIVMTLLGTALFAVEISSVSLCYRELTKGEPGPYTSGTA